MHSTDTSPSKTAKAQTTKASIRASLSHTSTEIIFL
ncbi:Dihydrolipoamide acyltransferase [Giardia duodenalis]|uniref:Dihydrolipoamide acyltransferase n=1 Tax=Giardia intestinalis TaxID=5741 RepID=V6TSJ4_GIAIN|nr:Dihydrolipoamide acyltransferase [Giardia intestinalis]